MSSAAKNCWKCRSNAALVWIVNQQRAQRDPDRRQIPLVACREQHADPHLVFDADPQAVTFQRGEERLQ